MAACINYLRFLALSLVLLELFSCSSSQNRKAESDKLFKTLVKIDSVQNATAVLYNYVYALGCTIDIIRKNDTTSIVWKTYREFQVFKNESRKLEDAIFNFKSALSAEVQKLQITEADTIQLKYMSNLLDKEISTIYLKSNSDALIDAIQPYFTRYELKGAPDLEQLRTSLLNKRSTFAEKYLVLQELALQMKRIEYDYYKPLLVRSVKNDKATRPY